MPATPARIKHSDGSIEPFQYRKLKDIPMRMADGREAEIADPANKYCGEHKALTARGRRNWDLIDWGKK